MAVKQLVRRGKKVWIVARVLRNDNGGQERYRRDASVQTRAGAEADERELLAYFRDHRTIEGFRRAADPVPDQPQPPVEKEKTWTDAVKRYRDDLLPTKKHETQVLYKKVLDSKYLIPWADLPLSTLQKPMLEQLDALLIKSKVGESRRRTFAAVYRGVLNGALDAKWIAELPGFPRLPKVPKKQMPYPCQEDVNALLDEKDDDCTPYHTTCRLRARLAFAIAAYAGLRAGEIRGLRWADVTLPTEGSTAVSQQGYITVRRSRGSSGIEGPPKSGSHRSVHIAPVLLPFLIKAHIEARRRAGQNRIDEAFVSVSGLGQPWGDTALRQALQRACLRLKLPKSRYHALRHFFITALFGVGVGAPTVQKLAGHSHLSTTQGYAHPLTDHVAAAFGRLGRGNDVATIAKEASKPLE